MKNKPKVYFISGHRDITHEEFKEHYVKRIAEILIKDNECHFILGDCIGLDSMALKLLYSYNVESDRITLYHVGPMVAQHTCHVVSDFESDEERDNAMTISSDEDIAWVRPGKEDSGTALNLKRRERYSAMKNMVDVCFDFSMALSYLKNDKVVRRKCWSNGECLYYVPKASYPVMTDNAKRFFGEGNLVQYGAYVAKRTKEDAVEIWTPQQEDLFANDWMLNK